MKKIYFGLSMISLCLTSCASTMNNGSIIQNRYVSTDTKVSVEAPISGDMFFANGLIDPSKPGYPQVPAMAIQDGKQSCNGNDTCYVVDFMAGNGCHLDEGASYSLEWNKSDYKKPFDFNKNTQINHYFEKFSCKTILLHHAPAQQCMGITKEKAGVVFTQISTIFNLNSLRVMAHLYYPSSKMAAPLVAYYHFIDSIKTM
jgi:hypothetical protein